MPRILELMELKKGMKLSEWNLGIMSEKNGKIEIWDSFYLEKNMATFLYSHVSKIYCICKSPKVEEFWQHILEWNLLFCNAHVISLWSLHGTDVLCYRTDLAQMRTPQPVNPELPSWPVSGFLQMLNNFRGKSQLFDDQGFISLDPLSLGTSLSSFVICILGHEE